MGLGYAVSDRGACHLRATFYKPELSGQIDRLKSEGKAKLFLFTEPIGEDGRVLDRDEFRELADEYYHLRGYELPLKVM